MRLAKYLASTGVSSRRKSEDIIQSGRVTVNGTNIIDPAFSVSEVDKILLDGKEVQISNKVYYLLNKPVGYTSTVSDRHADLLITELVPGSPSVWPVGRLDKNTSGLIIMTNDGDLTQKITHPSHQKLKEYSFSVDRPLSDVELAKMKKGIALEDGEFKPDHLEVLSQGKYLVRVHEGRNRLIRRSIEHFGKNITKLHRAKVGPLELGNLKMGEYRNLTEKELRSLLDA
ncbi:MAG: pseudouridine synthase [bacterium]